MNDIKPYNSLSSDEKKARRTFGYSSCVNCFAHKKGICNETIFDVCCNAYTKGFVAGTKKHRELLKEIKEKRKSKKSKVFKLTDEEIRISLIKYFKDYDYGYFAEVPREDIIEFLNSK